MRGSIVKRGRTWSYVLYLGRDSSGRKRQKWVGGFDTRREAEEALVAALGKRRDGITVDAGRMTVGEYLAEWLTGITPSLRATTALRYRKLMRDHVIRHIGNVRLADLTAPRIRMLHAELLENGRVDTMGGLSPTTVATVHRVLSHALKDAVTAGLLERNPAAMVKPPRRARPQWRVWSAEQVQRFLQAGAEDRLYGLWALLVTTGLRRGEALALRWEDVDLETGRLRVQRSFTTAGYEVHLTEPKTAAGRRSVSLDPQTTRVLAEHRRRQAEERLRVGPAWRDTGLVFTDELGQAIHPMRAYVLFRELMWRNPLLPKIRLHDLRNTAATLALAAGVHPKVVQERLGHANIAITLDTYSHVVEGLQEDAAARVADLVYRDERGGQNGARGS